MKRLWIFLLVGPLIAFFGALFGGAGYLLAIPYSLLLLIAFYIFGAIPSLLACLFDYGLSDKVGDFKRAAAISLIGCASGIFMAAYFPEHVGIIQMAIAGAVAGLICSLMSSEKQKEETLQ
jgi:NhaP-type Na+/H+ or K+/H+ antiporter